MTTTTAQDHDTPPLQRALAAFRARFGAEPTLAVRAPGRVNLIGEHTDYSEGYCLPCAIDRETVMVLAPNGTGEVRLHAADEPDADDTFAVDAPLVPGERRWANYVRGTLAALQPQGLVLRGCDVAIAGNVPLGAGLSSSAALEVAAGTVFAALAGAGFGARQIALAGQRAEHTFAGCECGIMDQLASAAGVAGHALLLDCRTLETRPVPLPEGTAVLVIHSRVQRGLVDSEYNQRRQQCQEAVRLLGVPMLRDVGPELEPRIATLPDDIARRARHVVGENRRTLDAAEALAAGDLVRMGELMRQSHVSMRDLFDIVPPSLDRLATLVNDVVGVDGGARMTGGGFGGCVVALVPRRHVAAVRDAVAAGYRSPQGEPALVWDCRASAGAGVVALPLPA
jgi:galactokinase